ncbi:MAG: box helicase domain protein [Bacteroidetes bacterium]|nr:box helicase domain protein [Bacteroidota bacterium]
MAPLTEGKTRFHDFDLPEEIMHAIADLGFQYCTPVQAAVLSKALAGIDVTGRAQTGTGKSAAFLITILAHIARTPLPGKPRRGTPRALILAPTRELVLQIEKDARGLSKYLPTKIVAVLGGMHYEKQKQLLSDGPVDIVVATPGRLLDFKRQGFVTLSSAEILVIDEADRMLDMGFIPDMRRIIESTPPKAQRQTMFFSATLTSEVKRLAVQWTKNAWEVDITPEQVAVNTIDQLVYITTTEEKFTLLYNMIVRQNLERVIIFANRRDETQRLAQKLVRYGITCGLLSGEVSQHQRIKTLENFRAGKFRALVATDVAARGLHIEGVSHVINYNLPMDPEDYVHRIGRTGRAGALGTSVSFACEDDGPLIPAIEEFIGRQLQSVYPEESWLNPLPPPTKSAEAASSTGTESNQRRKPGIPQRRRPGQSGERRGGPGRSRQP